MNYIVTAKPMHFPINLDRPVTRPVAPLADSTAGFPDARQQRPSNYVYHGELLDAASDKSYRPQHNLQISPENRRAINTYQKAAGDEPVVGKILDGFI